MACLSRLKDDLGECPQSVADHNLLGGRGHQQLEALAFGQRSKRSDNIVEQSRTAWALD